MIFLLATLFVACDNSFSNLEDIPKKCPNLIELILSGNNKLSQISQLEVLSKIESLVKFDCDGCPVAVDGHNKKIFEILGNLTVCNGYDRQGEEVEGWLNWAKRLTNKILTFYVELDEDEEEDEDSEEEEEGPGLSALYGK